jgi:hypothetical protein
MAEGGLRRYKYTALRFTDIRILKIHPGNAHMPLCCKLFEPRSTPVQYEALSYAWGEPTLTESFTETDTNTVIHIARNLHQALLNLCYDVGPQWLWVDAICINQSDNREQSSQVANMANTYMQAERVLVWIGYDEPGHDDCEETMHTLIKLAENLPDTNDVTLTNVLDDYKDPPEVRLTLLGNRRRLVPLEHKKGWRSKRDAPGANAQRSMISRKLIRSCNLMALDSFFGKAWSKRVWVVQEFVLPGEIHLFAGLHCITYPHFEAAVFALHKYWQLLSQSRPKTDRSILPQCVQSIEDVTKMLRFRSANRHSRVTIDSTFSVETTIRGSELPEWLDRSNVAITVKPSLYQCFRMFTH